MTEAHNFVQNKDGACNSCGFRRNDPKAPKHFADGECPGCGVLTPMPLAPKDWEGKWWCQDCLQAKCTKAWEATGSFGRTFEERIVTDEQIAAYKASVS